MTEYNDGTLQTGSRVLTIGSTDYIADNFSVNRPTKTIEQNDESDKPRKQKTYTTWVTGTATLQLDDKPPAFGDTFTVDDMLYEYNTATPPVLTAVTETFYITDVGQTESQGAEKKVNISFRKKYN